jgi:hypothetical protein
MHLIRDAPEVWLDTGPFCRACEAGAMGVLREMAAFLGPKARWTQEVRREVRDRARGKGGQGGESALHHRLSQLTTLNFPHDSKGARLSEEVRAKVTQLQSALAFDGSTRTHLGEIATVLTQRP